MTRVAPDDATAEAPAPFDELASLLAPVLDAQPFRPVPVFALELADGLHRLRGVVEAHAGSNHALVLCRLHGRPLGLVLFDCRVDHDRRAWTATVDRRLGAAIANHFERDDDQSTHDLWHGWTETDEPPCRADHDLARTVAPPVTVVVATRERPVALARCVRSLTELDYPNFDVVVVDNAPGTTQTRRTVEAFQDEPLAIRYVREDRRGLANAHNAALEHVSGEIIAITDDDVVVDRDWLTELVVPFVAGEQVAAATGLILPAELETEAQAVLEAHGRYVKGYEPRRFDLGAHRPADPRFPFTAGTMGAGANMAFRAEFLRRLGGFDPCLGAGTIAKGGDDLAAFFEVVTSGATLAYRPSAVVWHHHRRDDASIAQQVHDYGVGLGAYLASALFHHPGWGVALLRRAPAGVALLRQREADRAGRRWPPELERLARRGLLYGPIAYSRSRWAHRRVR
jgi:GT2 family glycosyltransferase